MIKLAAIFSLLSSTTYAACIDAGTSAFDNDPRVLDLCDAHQCEPATLTRMCGNIHYSSMEYQRGEDHWWLRVRTHGEGPEDDEYNVLLNGAAVTPTVAQQISCIPKSSPSDCAFINDVLEQYR